jgi:hypothetical protein
MYPCKKVQDLEEKVAKCKVTFEGEISVIHTSVDELKSEVHGLRLDLHKMAESVGSINTSLETIADTMTKLTDFPDTWTKIQGFWSVMRWAKDNFIPMAVVLATLGYLVHKLAENSGIFS